MASFVWSGHNGNFFDATKWQPYGVPRDGDSIAISSGLVWATNTTLPGTIALGSTNPNNVPNLDLFNGTIGNINVQPSPGSAYAYRSPYANITVNGVVGVRAGASIVVAGGDLNITVAPNSVFDNHGVLSTSGEGIMRVLGGPFTTFVNDGEVSLFGGDAVIQSNIVGTGSMVLNGKELVDGIAGGQMTLEGSVAAGQTIFLGLAGPPNNDGGGVLILTQPMRFGGVINEGSRAGVLLLGMHETSSTYSQGLLDIFDYGKLIAALHINNPQGSGFDVANYSPGGNYSSGIDISPHFAPPMLHHG